MSLLDIYMRSSNSPTNKTTIMTRLEEAQQELKTHQERMVILQTQQRELKITESSLKKKIKATEEEIELLTPKDNG